MLLCAKSFLSRTSPLDSPLTSGKKAHVELYKIWTKSPDKFLRILPDSEWKDLSIFHVLERGEVTWGYVYKECMYFFVDFPLGLEKKFEFNLIKSKIRAAKIFWAQFQVQNVKIFPFLRFWSQQKLNGECEGLSFFFPKGKKADFWVQPPWSQKKARKNFSTVKCFSVCSNELKNEELHKILALAWVLKVAQI